MGVVQQQTVLCLLLWSHFGMKHESSEVIEEALIWFMNGTGNETKRPFCQHGPAKTALRWRLWNYLSDFPSDFFWKLRLATLAIWALDWKCCFAPSKLKRLPTPPLSFYLGCFVIWKDKRRSKRSQESTQMFLSCFISIQGEVDCIQVLQT